MSLYARVHMCACVFVFVCVYICVCVVWRVGLPLLHVHSPYDTTMTRLSRLEKGSGAREAPATQ